jgi:hypothetical protein
MQRWIVLGVAAMVLLFGGGAFALRTYKQNRPNPVWVPLPLNPNVSVEKQDELARELKAKLSEREKLVKVSHDLSLPKEWALPTDEVCADVLARRIFVRSGEHETPMGKVPSVNVGIDGKRKERVISEKIAMRLMKDVWEHLGVKVPPTAQ